ncbi:MAG TPA: phosphatidate cytidylyltransferase [Bacteroidales bacterium]|nr:phosphatidate cytidylyltransferase [Bacteroidales bacterium]
MSNFWARTITGLSMVFVLLAALFFSYWLVAAFFLLVTFSALWEFYNLFTTENSFPQKIFGITGGCLLYISLVLMQWADDKFGEPSPFILLPILVPLLLIFLAIIAEVFRKKPFPVTNIGITLTGIFYIALPLGLLNLMNTKDTVHFLHFPAYLTGYFLITWIYDTGAYLYGKQFGRHPFFERISPKKTWEGTIAGVIVASAAAVGLYFLVREIRLVDWLALTGLVIVFGTFGDLAESLFKRSLGIKDSGNLLPGHGGVLDRFDTFFLSAPFVYLYFLFTQIVIIR